MNHERLNNHERHRRPRLRALPVNSLIPNMLTVISLCAGLTSIRFSLNERWELAVLAIVFAGIMDGLDGRLARLLKGVTRFGAELDSLADFLSFGVAPVFVLYLWSLNSLGGFAGMGWIAVLVYAVCCALRLARFNTMADAHQQQPAWTLNFFVGVAAPAAAGLAILPPVLTFQIPALEPVLRSPYLLAPYVMGIAALMVSRVPTVSLKRLRVQRSYVLPILLGIGIGVAALTVYPWVTLGACGIAYLVSIPITAYRYLQLQHRHSLRPAAAEPAEGTPASPPAASSVEPPAFPADNRPARLH
ncbi:MAG: phosphatidylcholine/phosphatidylserine synthase [Alphaproteobacteria bacterium]|nr:phosphatidylcholine/phosphatidylserine synthase [Alphaproteobacteria bacterium]